ncbi:hypothetical protein AAFF_G00412320 [Aldrovandia affinis]|uniref:Uncharacterized protein n=1 Tax=Aldrovandia affinis TaxID=143900 RepID=A0AAD7R3V0_9TELE|nr:hypothetical protein AAFF_G00412320 [Aldrovandia affinis]
MLPRQQDPGNEEETLQDNVEGDEDQLPDTEQDEILHDNVEGDEDQLPDTEQDEILHGCNKCLKTFKKASFGAKTDFSGFDRSTWPLRTSEEHKTFAKMTEKATTKAAQKKLEAQYGARWSELFFLPYYDAIRFVVIDPMHNLLLGTARHVLKLWIELGVLSIQKFEELQRRMDSLKSLKNQSLTQLQRCVLEL